MRRPLLSLSAAVIAAVCLPSVAAAQQSFSFHIGGFTPRSLDARSDNDVLVQDLFNGDYALDFDVDERLEDWLLAEVSDKRGQTVAASAIWTRLAASGAVPASAVGILPRLARHRLERTPFPALPELDAMAGSEARVLRAWLALPR